MTTIARLIPVILSLLLLHLSEATFPHKRLVCVTRTTMPHDGVAVPYSAPAQVDVPLRIHERCAKRRRERPLLLVVPGALVRTFEYSMLANVLARAGFIVAIPPYSRDFYEQTSPFSDPFRDFVRSTREMGFKCPRIGQFPTIKLISSMLKFFVARNRESGMKNIANVGKTIIFGHSVGGALAQNFLNDFCANLTKPVIPPPVPLFMNPDLPARIICEQFKPMHIPGARVRGVVSYEGFQNDTVITANSKTFYVEIHSSFFDSQVAELRNKSFDGNAATVRLRMANHFGPMNFVKENENQRSVCALPRMPPEDMFTTTRDVQRRVVKSVARTVMAAFNEFVRSVSGGGVKGLSTLVRRRGLLVDSVELL